MAALDAQINEVDDAMRYVTGFVSELFKGLDKFDAIIESLREKVWQVEAARREALCDAVVEHYHDQPESDVEFTDQQRARLLAEVIKGDSSTTPA
jgi:hypothetical protein